MEAVAHNPTFAKQAGVPQSVGQDFATADKKTQSFADGGQPRPKGGLAQAIEGDNDTSHNELTKQFPKLSGFLQGLLGNAPDELGNSVMDPLTQQIRAGAEYGYPHQTLRDLLAVQPHTLDESDHAFIGAMHQAGY